MEHTTQKVTLLNDKLLMPEFLKMWHSFKLKKKLIFVCCALLNINHNRFTVV